MKTERHASLFRRLLGAAVLTVPLIALSSTAAAAGSSLLAAAGIPANIPPGPHPPPSGSGPFSYTASLVNDMVVIGPGTTNGVAVGTVSVTNTNPVSGVLSIVVGVALKDGNCSPGREVTWALIDSVDYSTYTPIHAPARGTAAVNFPTPLVFNTVNPSVSGVACILVSAVADQAGSNVELFVQLVGKYQ